MRKTIAAVLVLVLAFGSLGCATSQHGIEFSNVSAANLREVYIRNAGSNSWGSNMVRELDNIDRTRFSSTVDMRVVDNNGIVYTKYGVSLGDSAFIETEKNSTLNPFAGILLATAILIPLLIFTSGD